MNKDNAKDYLPLVQALVDGKAVQIIDRDCSTWMDSDELDFRYPVSHYRIKPEPREIFSIRYADGHETSACFNHEEDAKSASNARLAPKIVRYREVIE